MTSMVTNNGHSLLASQRVMLASAPHWQAACYCIQGLCPQVVAIGQRGCRALGLAKLGFGAGFPARQQEKAPGWETMPS